MRTYREDRGDCHGTHVLTCVQGGPKRIVANQFVLFAFTQGGIEMCEAAT